MTRAKFIEELQKVLVETICENQGKPVVFDFVDKDDDDDEYILATMLFDNHCIAMSSNPRWDGSTFAMNPWETKICMVSQGWDYILDTFLDKVLDVQEWDNLEEQLFLEKDPCRPVTFYVKRDLNR